MSSNGEKYHSSWESEDQTGICKDEQRWAAESSGNSDGLMRPTLIDHHAAGRWPTTQRTSSGEKVESFRLAKSITWPEPEPERRSISPPEEETEGETNSSAEAWRSRCFDFDGSQASGSYCKQVMTPDINVIYSKMKCSFTFAQFKMLWSNTNGDMSQSV